MVQVETKIECACCEQLKEVRELIQANDNKMICKDRIKCNETYYEILNTI